MKKGTKPQKFLNCLVSFDAKSITKSAEGNLIIEGYANTSHVDRVGDNVLPSAFEKTLPEYMKNPVLLSQHDWDLVIGKVLEAEIIEDTPERAGGLWIKAMISSADDVASVREKIREGILTTFSIGYNEIEATYDRSKDIFIVKEVELLEVSVVTIPANPNARFTLSDSANNTPEPTQTLNVVDISKFNTLAEALNELEPSEKVDAEFLKELFEIIFKGE